MQNRERFGERATHIEEMNDAADRAANSHEWNNVPYPLHLCHRKYITTINQVLVTQHPGKEWKQARYRHHIEDWKKRQPVRTAFLNTTVDPSSLPKKCEAFANLTCKILTGTIWTAKLKHRLKMVESPDCLSCLSQDIHVIDDSEHTLGLCPAARKLNDDGWREILNIGKQHNIDTQDWMPWFHTTIHHDKAYSMPSSLGDKGLTPTHFRARVYAENRHIPKTKLKGMVDKIIQYWRWAVRNNYVQRITTINVS